MSNEITKVNGVTKREENGKYVYTFPLAFITADPTVIGNESVTYYLKNTATIPFTILFANVTDKLGQTDVVSYVDELANQQFYFDAVPDPSGLDYLAGAYMTAISSVNQNIQSSGNIPIPINFGNIIESKDVTIMNGSELMFSNDGLATGFLECHLTKTGGGTETVNFWIQYFDGANWIDIDNSGVEFNFNGQNEGSKSYTFQAVINSILKYRIVSYTNDPVTLENKNLINNVFVPGSKIRIR